MPDLAPLLDTTPLRSLSFRRTVHSNDELPVLAAFDNAHVIDVLRQRGVAVDIT
ncbi:hypothetical protein [Kibdelosporangium aridum]|uniref:hypothetical protein n=1 Tax=Kibdelosporangium aridum TaxID=2030 RepID=UPI000B2444DD|nr:hypothetical protein [Kibdelosporangium aridum]